jgi:hypothetical protein
LTVVFVEAYDLARAAIGPRHRSSFRFSRVAPADVPEGQSSRTSAVALRGGLGMGTDSDA